MFRLIIGNWTDFNLLFFIIFYFFFQCFVFVRWSFSLRGIDVTQIKPSILWTNDFLVFHVFQWFECWNDLFEITNLIESILAKFHVFFYERTQIRYNALLIGQFLIGPWKRTQFKTKLLSISVSSPNDRMNKVKMRVKPSIDWLVKSDRCTK